MPKSQKPPVYLKTVDDMVRKVEELSQTILVSTRKAEIVKAFKTLECIIKGPCLCDTCDSWGELMLTHEFGRCFVPSRFFQLVKDRHQPSKRWDAYVQELYTSLFRTIYDDIDPSNNNKVIHSEFDQECVYKLPPSLVKSTKELVASERMKRLKKQLKKSKNNPL